MITIRRVCFLLLLLSLPTSAWAQSAAITSLSVDEPSRTLFIRGSNFGTSPGKIFVDSIAMPVTLWMDTLVTCTLPDSGRGYAGEVTVAPLSSSPTMKLLSDLAVKIQYVYSYAHGGPPIFQSWSAVWHLRFRLQLPNPSGITLPLRGSSAGYNYSGSAYYDDHDNFHPYQSQGSGATRIGGHDSLGRLSFTADCMVGYDSSLQVSGLGIQGATFTVTYENTVSKSETRSLYISIGDARITLDSSYHVKSVNLVIQQQAQGIAGITESIADDSSTFLPPRSAVSSTSAQHSEASIFPNPSDGNINISLDLPSSGHLAIQIFDILGRLKATVADGEFAKGHCIFNTHEFLSMGVYTCRITGPGFERTLKFVSR